jgi:hypothetical protein
MKIQPDTGRDRVWPWLLGVAVVVIAVLAIIIR